MSAHVIPTADGMLAHLVGQRRPDLAERIAATGRIETAIVGLGNQGKRHAKMMRDFGTTVTAGVAADGLQVVHGNIPVYPTVAEMMEAHPNIAAVSIWKHYSTARHAALECIEAGIPIVVLISEGMPVRDVRDVLAAARAKNTLLLGPNTPGIIFPPERVKVGMLPDVFHPAEPEPGRFSAEGVTICSRSGAILYHMSDALASAGIAQNAVIGVGGDSCIGTPFPKLVPLVMSFPDTHLVVVAGEIGGFAEEMLAEEIRKHPEQFTKPIVALISGRCAPEGKTMGHAGAIVAPGADYGTWKGKRDALESVGVTVVNNQWDLIEAVKAKLEGRTYFNADDYYDRMRHHWESPPPVPGWATSITEVKANHLSIRGEPLQDLIGKFSLVQMAGLLVNGELIDAAEHGRLDAIAAGAAAEPVVDVPLYITDDLGKQLAALLLTDPGLADFRGTELEQTVYGLGRVGAFFGRILDHHVAGASTLAQVVARAMGGELADKPGIAKLLEALVVASVDHGVTPPSAQATVIASTVRGAYEVAVSAGIMAITDVHGGAGAKAAEFFRECAALAKAEDLPLDVATERLITERSLAGARIEGLGHRIHTKDPRRDALWTLADNSGAAGPCVEISQLVEKAFRYARGMKMPVNVDGVIGAIVADLGLDSRVAKAAFMYGRVAGLSAHHFEEVATMPRMRRVDFSKATFSPPR